MGWWVGEEWCPRDPKVSAAPRGKDGREGKKRERHGGGNLRSRVLERNASTGYWLEGTKERWTDGKAWYHIRRRCKGCVDGLKHDECQRRSAVRTPSKMRTRVSKDRHISK
jgi:hypothetical protein